MSKNTRLFMALNVLSQQVSEQQNVDISADVARIYELVNSGQHDEAQAELERLEGELKSE